MKALTNIEITKYLGSKLNNWTFEKKAIKRDLKFKSFVEAFSFMTSVALEAEKLNHHPDWTNIYNKVSINLYTHEINGVTEKDLHLAQKIDDAFANFH